MPVLQVQEESSLVVWFVEEALNRFWGLLTAPWRASVPGVKVVEQWEVVEAFQATVAGLLGDLDRESGEVLPEKPFLVCQEPRLNLWPHPINPIIARKPFGLVKGGASLLLAGLLEVKASGEQIFPCWEQRSALLALKSESHPWP